MLFNYYPLNTLMSKIDFLKKYGINLYRYMLYINFFILQKEKQRNNIIFSCKKEIRLIKKIRKKFIDFSTFSP